MHRSYCHQVVCQIALLALSIFTACSSPSPSKPASNVAGGGVTVGGASSKPATNNPDDFACTLVTRAEAEAVMGEKLKDGESGPASMQGGSICRYDSPESLSARNVMVRVESPNFDWNKYKEDKRIEGQKMQPRRGYIREVPGLGKDAYFARHTLHVLTDKGILTISIFKTTADAVAGEEKETPTETAEKTLAEKAITRM